MVENITCNEHGQGYITSQTKVPLQNTYSRSRWARYLSGMMNSMRSGHHIKKGGNCMQQNDIRADFNT